MLSLSLSLGVILSDIRRHKTMLVLTIPQSGCLREGPLERIHAMMRQYRQQEQLFTGSTKVSEHSLSRTVRIRRNSIHADHFHLIIDRFAAIFLKVTVPT